MFGSTFALAMGVVFLGVVRFSADRGSVGILAALGIVFVAIACALHTAAILRGLAFLTPLVRGLAIAISWVAWMLAAVWLLRFDHRPEKLLAVFMTPAALGVTGLLVSPANRGWAAAFLTEAVVLIALLGPVLFQRMAD